MTDLRQANEYAVPLYKRRNHIISALITVVVLAISGLVIWQMHSGAVGKIDSALQQQAQNGVSELKRQDFANSVETDPVGFELANYIQTYYPTIVLLTYFVLAAFGVAAVTRFLIFLLSSSKRNQYYPSDAALDHFLRQDIRSWDDFYHYSLAQDNRDSKFWRILQDSVKVTNISGRHDHLYLHFRNRIDRITEHMDEMALYDSIATASPAAGFFGTLVGFLYIFSQGQSAATLSQSVEFTIGLKVALITSLWGLINLGLAIGGSYFSRRIIDQIHHQMVVRAVAVCEVVETLKIPQSVKEIEIVLAQNKEQARANS